MKARHILLGVLGFVAIIGVFLILMFTTGMLQRGTAEFRGQTKQIEQTKANSNYRIAQYEHFYNLCASVQSIESKIGNMEDELDTASEAQRKEILNTSITASKNKRAELINKYNADARKEGTMAQFKSSDLPYSIDENEEVTVCEVY